MEVVGPGQVVPVGLVSSDVTQCPGPVRDLALGRKAEPTRLPLAHFVLKRLRDVISFGAGNKAFQGQPSRLLLFFVSVWV